MLLDSALRRRDSCTITSTYSRFFSSGTSGRCSRAAKPAMEVMGVLNSWEKLLMKSLRNISVLSSSRAMWLKLVMSMPTSELGSLFSTCTL